MAIKSCRCEVKPSGGIAAMSAIGAGNVKTTW
jgi:hypothetical protein